MSNANARLSKAATLPFLLSAMTTHAAPQIPLCPGLKIVTAVSQSAGDYESIKTIESVSPTEVKLKYTSEAPDRGLFASSSGETIKTTVYRRILTADLRASNLYMQVFDKDADELLPRTTAIGTSSAVLAALKTKGEATMSISNASAGAPMKADENLKPNVYDYFTPGTLKKVGTVKVPVLVNDELVELTAIHARGEFVGEQNEFFFLDDEANPLTLKFRLGIDAIKPMVPELAETCAGLRKAGPAAIAGFEHQCLEKGGDRDTLQVIKITHRCAPPQQPGAGAGTGDMGTGASLPEGGSGSMAALEQALQETGKAEIYSIYFSFDSDAIRPESADTLREIAAIMRKHPEWRLSIHGHTDNIASDAYNLDLSKRRAAAVVKALTGEHGIAPQRLTSTGHGESSPIDTNETLEGRARNRRVELVRLP